MFAAITNGLKAIASIFGWAQQRDAEENTPKMQSNKEAQAQQDAVDKATKDVVSGDISKVREDLS